MFIIWFFWASFTTEEIKGFNSSPSCSMPHRETMLSLVMFKYFSSWWASKGVSQSFYNLCPSLIKKNIMFLWKLFYTPPAEGEDWDGWGEREGWLVHLFSVFWVSSLATKIISNFFCSFLKNLFIVVYLFLDTKSVILKTFYPNDICSTLQFCYPSLDMQDYSSLPW